MLQNVFQNYITDFEKSSRWIFFSVTAVFSLVRPDSWTPNEAMWYGFAHLGISLRMLKLHMGMMAQKNRNKKF